MTGSVGSYAGAAAGILALLYLPVWFCCNLRSLLAIVGGFLAGWCVLIWASLGISFCFGFAYAASGVPQEQAIGRMLHSPWFWLLWLPLSAVFMRYTGFLTGMAAGRDEIIHACVAGLLMIMPVELDSNTHRGVFYVEWYQMPDWFNALLGVTAVPLAGWGGHTARKCRRQLRAIEEPLRHRASAPVNRYQPF